MKGMTTCSNYGTTRALTVSKEKAVVFIVPFFSPKMQMVLKCEKVVKKGKIILSPTSLDHWTCTLRHPLEMYS